MKFGEFKEKVISNYKEVFPYSACTVTLGALGGDTIFVNYYLAGNQSEFPNNISQNDLFDIQFFIRQGIDRNEDDSRLTDDSELVEPLTMEVNYKSIKTTPEKQYFAYGSVSLPFRKTVGNADKIVLTLKKYAEVTKITLEDLYKSDKLPANQQKNIVDLVKSKLGLADDTLTESEKSSIEDHWDATIIDSKVFVDLLKFNFGFDMKGNNYIVLNDNNEMGRFYAKSDDEAREKFRREFLKENFDTTTEYNRCYDFTMVLQTSNPESEELKKLEHHIDYLIDFNTIEYQLYMYNVVVEQSGDSEIVITGKIDLADNENTLTSDDMADILTCAVDETGWEDLGLLLESVVVTECS